MLDFIVCTLKYGGKSLGRVMWCPVCGKGSDFAEQCPKCQCKNMAFTFADPFTDDPEKMRDFYELTKEEFLQSYSYLTEEEYDATAAAVQKTE